VQWCADLAVDFQRVVDSPSSAIIIVAHVAAVGELELGDPGVVSGVGADPRGGFEDAVFLFDTDPHLADLEQNGIARGPRRRSARPGRTLRGLVVEHEHARATPLR
jgi:hypothetical protein